VLGLSGNFEVTQSNFNLAINADAIDLWVKYRYVDSSMGALDHIACYQGNYYCSWISRVKILVWNDLKKRQAHWKTVPCPEGLKHISHATEGTFEIQSKKCICPTRALMLSGCNCGGE